MSGPADASIYGDFERLPEAPVGSGATGHVYRARQRSVDRIVALKILDRNLEKSDGLATLLGRFQREANALGRLKHPNIVTIHAAGEKEGVPWIAMEYLEGGTLADEIDRRIHERRPFTEAEIARIGLATAKGLAAAHKEGIVHRDLKPSNILFDRDGRAVLTDFGIAKFIDDTKAGQKVTATGDVVGTPEYMAPEQIYPGERRVLDHRVDLYALGVVLYEMATLAAPFSGRSPFDTMHKHLNVDAAPFRTSHPEYSENLEGLVLRCLAKTPEERPGYDEAIRTLVEILSYAESAGALESVEARLEAQAPARPAVPASRGMADEPSRLDSPSSSGGRRSLVVATVGILALAAAAGLYAFRHHDEPVDSPRPTPVEHNLGPATPSPTSGHSPTPSPTPATSPPSPSTAPAAELPPGTELPYAILPDVADLQAPAEGRSALRHALAMEALSRWAPGRQDTIEAYLAGYVPTPEELGLIREMGSVLSMEGDEPAGPHGPATLLDALRFRPDHTPYTGLLLEAARKTLHVAETFRARLRRTIFPDRECSLVDEDGSVVAGTVARVTARDIVLAPSGGRTERHVAWERLAVACYLRPEDSPFERALFLVSQGDPVEGAGELFKLVIAKNGIVSEPALLPHLPSAIQILAGRSLRDLDRDRPETLDRLALRLEEAKPLLPKALRFAFEPVASLRTESQAYREWVAGRRTVVVERFPGTRSFQRAARALRDDFAAKAREERLAGGQFEHWEVAPFEKDVDERSRHLYSDAAAKAWILDQGDGSRQISRRIEEAAEGYALEFQFSPSPVAEKSKPAWALILSDPSCASYIQVEGTSRDLLLYERKSGNAAGKEIARLSLPETEQAWHRIDVVPVGRILLVHFDGGLAFRVELPAEADRDPSVRLGVSFGILRIRSVRVVQDESK